MSGFGSMQHAATIMKNNLERRRIKREGRKKRGYSTKHKKTEFDFPKVSEEELKQIKANIRAKGKRRRTIEYSITITATIIVFILIYIYWF